MLKWVAAACGLMACSCAMAWQVDLPESGLRAELQAAIDQQHSEAQAQQRTLAFSDVESALLADLQSRGYYQAYVRRLGDVLSIELGDPIRIRQIQLSGLEASGRLVFPAYPQHEGDVLDQLLYNNFKAAVDNRFLEQGYFSARWLESQIALDLFDNQAVIRLSHERGERSRFGEVSFVDERGEPLQSLSPFWLKRLTPFKAGDYYRSKLLIDLQNNLLNTRYFSDVQVALAREPASDGQELMLPVRVQVRDDKPNKLSLGLGYATDVGVRASVDWQRPRLNPQGHGVSVSTQVSAVRQETQWHYQMPYNHPTEDTVQFSLGALYDTIDETRTRKLVFGMHRVIAPQRGWQLSFGSRVSQERFADPGLTARTEQFVLPNVSLSHRRARGGTDPHQGFSQRYQIEASSRELLSDASLLALRGKWQWLETFRESHLMLLRGELGHVVTRDILALPPTMRFYAGGDNSVRGYSYRDLAPKNSAGETLGGQSMVTGSVEYQWHWRPSWRPAFFVDAGQAFTEQWVPLSVGAGVGMRWISPVGPIQLDLANAVSEDKRPWRIHFTIGAPL